MFSGCWLSRSTGQEITVALMLQEDALSLAVPRQRRRRRRKIEIEAERAAKRRNLMEMVAQLRESHAATESQSQAIDLTKVHTQSLKFINKHSSLFVNLSDLYIRACTITTRPLRRWPASPVAW